MSKKKLTRALVVSIMFATICISCTTSDKSYNGPIFALNEMIKDIKRMGSTDELRVADIRKLKRRTKMEILTEKSYEVTLQKRTFHGNIRMNYEIGDDGMGVLEDITFDFDKEIKDKKVDNLSHKLNKLFKEKPKLEYGKPISKKDKKKRYKKFVNSDWKGVTLYYDMGANDTPVLVLSVSKGLRDISESYYLSKVYEYELE